MPPGRKSASTSSKSSSSSYGFDSSSVLVYDCGTVVWCKYKKYPFWPGIIIEQNRKTSRTSYEVLFFGTFTLGLVTELRCLEPFEGLAQFKKRLTDLKSSEVLVKNRPSHYDMNITLANVESFQDAVKQATRVARLSSGAARLELADQMRNGVTCDFFQLQIADEEEIDLDSEEIDDRNQRNRIDDDPLTDTIQNDRQFIQTMIDRGRQKRKFHEAHGRHQNGKIRRLTMKTEPDQVALNPPASILLRNSKEKPFLTCSNFVCHSLSPTEERFIIDAINRSGSNCSFFQAKQIAEQMYSNISSVNNSNRLLAVSELWFYLFFYLHFDELFTAHPHWLGDLEKNPSDTNYIFDQEQQIIRLMKTYLR